MVRMLLQIAIAYLASVCGVGIQIQCKDFPYHIITSVELFPLIRIYHPNLEVYICAALQAA